VVVGSLQEQDWSKVVWVQEVLGILLGLALLLAQDMGVEQT